MTTPKTENEKKTTEPATKPDAVVGGQFTAEERDRERKEADKEETAKSSAQTDRIGRKRSAPRISDEEQRPNFVSELQRDNYYRDLDNRQRQRDEAYDKYPPGTKLRVTTSRGITSRRRAGIDFTSTPVTIEVVAEAGPALAKRRSNGESMIVDPEGAKAILEDDGLLAFKGADVGTAEEKDAQIADMQHQIAALQAENARLARDAKPAGLMGGTVESNPFGGSEQPKTEGKLANPTRRTPA